MHIWWILLDCLIIASGFQLPTFSRIDVVIADSGERFNFTWRRFSDGIADGGIIDWITAWRFCDQRAAQLPHTNELRYFYKSLLSQGKGEESSFYLADFMETTTDQPNEFIGERMCTVIKGTLGEPVGVLDC